MAQSLDLFTDGLQRQMAGIRAAGQKVPELKKEMLTRAGGKLTEEVRRSIRSSGLNDRHGRVQSWQNPHVGTSVGYVAVRADSVQVAAGGSRSQRVNAGALTNWLTNDRKVRGPSGRSKRYRPAGRMAIIKGRKFYATAAESAQRIAEGEARQMLDQLAQEVERG